MTYAREKDYTSVFMTDYFTANEEALKEKVGEETNFSFIFKHPDFVKKLVDNYIAHGITITDEELVKAFLNEEKVAWGEHKKLFPQLREIFSISQPPKEDPPKSDQTDNVNKEEAPKEKDIKPNEIINKAEPVQAKEVVK
jgi:hypothetical protein